MIEIFTWLIIITLASLVSFIIGVNVKEWRLFDYGGGIGNARRCKICGQQQRLWGRGNCAHWIEFGHTDLRYNRNCPCHGYAKE